MWNKLITQLATNPLDWLEQDYANGRMQLLLRYSPLSLNTKVCPITTNTCFPVGADAVRVVLPCDSAALVARLQQQHRGVKVRTPWPAASCSCHSTTSCFSAGSSPAVLAGQEGSGRSRGVPGELDSKQWKFLELLSSTSQNHESNGLFFFPRPRNHLCSDVKLCWWELNGFVCQPPGGSSRVTTSVTRTALANHSEYFHTMTFKTPFFQKHMVQNKYEQQKHTVVVTVYCILLQI